MSADQVQQNATQHAEAVLQATKMFATEYLVRLLNIKAKATANNTELPKEVEDQLAAVLQANAAHETLINAAASDQVTYANALSSWYEALYLAPVPVFATWNAEVDISTEVQKNLGLSNKPGIDETFLNPANFLIAAYRSRRLCHELFKGINSDAKACNERNFPKFLELYKLHHEFLDIALDTDMKHRLESIAERQGIKLNLLQVVFVNAQLLIEMLCDVKVKSSLYFSEESALLSSCAELCVRLSNEGCTAPALDYLIAKALLSSGLLLRRINTPLDAGVQSGRCIKRAYIHALKAIQVAERLGKHFLASSSYEVASNSLDCGALGSTYSCDAILFLLEKDVEAFQKSITLHPPRMGSTALALRQDTLKYVQNRLQQQGTKNCSVGMLNDFGKICDKPWKTRIQKSWDQMKCKVCDKTCVHLKKCPCGDSSAKYCSTECQTKHWKDGHKQACTGKSGGTKKH